MFPPANRPQIENLLEQYGIQDSHLKSALRLNSLACVALPTCGLALAEAERYLPDLLTELGGNHRGKRPAPRRHHHPHDRLPERLRPSVHRGDRLGRPRARTLQRLSGRRIRRPTAVETLSGKRARRRHQALLAPIITRYAKERHDGERFGDFCIRAGYVAATVQGADFHQNIQPEAFAKALRIGSIPPTP